MNSNLGSPKGKRGPQPALPCPREQPGSLAGRGGCQRVWPTGPEVPASARAWHRQPIHRGTGGAGQAGLKVPTYPRRAPER